MCQHYIEVLWFQYYKLYVVGYGNHEDKKIILDDQIDYDNNDSGVTCFSYIAKNCTGCIDQDSNEEQPAVDHYTCCHDDEKLGTCTCVNILKILFRTLLLLVQFLVQAATIPLLFLQLLDSYSLLCFFSPMYFCGSSSSVAYELSLAQAAITLLFYCCLALTQLASTMLNWSPWPKKNDESDEDSQYIVNNNSHSYHCSCCCISLYS